MCMEPETTTVVGECPIHGGGGVCTVCENGPEAHVFAEMPRSYRRFLPLTHRQLFLHPYWPTTGEVNPFPMIGSWGTQVS